MPRSGRTRQDVADSGGTLPCRPDEETFAGFLTHTDRQVGRLIALQWRRGELDSALITVISGNGVKDALSDETKADKGER